MKRKSTAAIHEEKTKQEADELMKQKVYKAIIEGVCFKTH